MIDLCLLLHIFKDDSGPVQLMSSGRPKRRTRKLVDYSEKDTDSVKDLEKYLEKVQKEMESQERSVYQFYLCSKFSCLMSQCF